MDIDWDLLTEPEEPKPAWDGVYDEEWELEKFNEYQAAHEYEYRARSEVEKQDEAWWKIVNHWNLDGYLGAGIMLYFYDPEGWL